MDSSTPTPVITAFDPQHAWRAAALSAELHRQETRRRQEAQRIMAMMAPEDNRPTLPAPAAHGQFTW